MSIEQDYIMRTVMMLARFLTRALLLRKAHDYPQLLVEMDDLARRALGIDRETAHRLTTEQLIEFFKSHERLAGAKCYILGMILKEEGESLREQERIEESTAIDMKALHLLLEGLLYDRREEGDGHADAITALIDRLRPFALPDPLASDVALFYEYMGRLDKAEDILCDILDHNNDYRDTLADFYHRLLNKPDQELTRGNLPREEVEEGLARLRKLPRPPET